MYTFLYSSTSKYVYAYLFLQHLRFKDFTQKYKIENKTELKIYLSKIKQENMTNQHYV